MGVYTIKKIKDNYMYLIGFIISFVLCGGVVYASINYSANEFYYDKTSSTLNSTNIQGAIDELAQKYADLTTCPSNRVCVQLKNTLAVGDYVSYTPTKTSYTTDTTKTGYTTAQTINPSELNLWRVLSVNGDGTVDIISEYVSSVDIYFNGLTGYKNYVGYLNVLASQYEISGITSGSRYYGYSNQTEYITSNTYFTYPAPWTESPAASYEPYGGGEHGENTDQALINSVLGTGKAKRPNGTSANYWIASRSYAYFSATSYCWYLDAGYDSTSAVPVYCYSSSAGSLTDYNGAKALRPIIRLRSGLTYSGVGNTLFPMEIVG